MQIGDTMEREQEATKTKERLGEQGKSEREGGGRGGGQQQSHFIPGKEKKIQKHEIEK